MTKVPSFQFDDVEILLAQNPPFVINENPAPGATGVLVGTSIIFDLIDPDGDLDLTSVLVTLEDDLGNSFNVIVGGVAQAGYSFITTPITNGFTYIITPDENLVAFTVYTVHVSADDTGAPATELIDHNWSFDTEDGPLDSPTLIASPQSSEIAVSWSAVEGMRSDAFMVRRSESSPPMTVSEGDEFYVGDDLSKFDIDTEIDITYYYTVFVIRRYENGVPNYYDVYDERASDDATIKARILPTIRGTEYIPGAGELGDRVNPFTSSSLTLAYGDQGTRESDLYEVPRGTAIKAPVTCSVKAIGTSSESDLSKVVELENDKFLFILDGFVPSVSEGDELTIGQLIGRSVGQQIIFQIFRKQTGTQPKRVVRPSRFFVKTEDRQ